ncbi:MAG: hypothetical protein FJ265_11315 [Planctomycetes bacterium]|nr:hypothetical protein [Planctomycetota bacterium]
MVSATRKKGTAGGVAGSKAARAAAHRGRRSKPGRRRARRGKERCAPPLAEVDADALEFIAAIDRFKQQHGRPFPSWSEVLMVLRELGYSRR